ncbi:hypothetical protein [Telmatospirillum sp.]|uniref:hypothetical protein n=1 Tax=Telmatospirillum sp. TaxID=2079197 RepID=UPI0028470148|nr:hypothetical protein [Telmatospirillum sp.]MDR3436424.1 hypothetical protein [Telmatospirillum sp.]
MGILAGLKNLVLPKRAPQQATAFTGTFNPYLGGQYLPVPAFRDHLNDIQDLRQSYNSQQLQQLLFRQDPDVSATVNAYLTMADTDPLIYVKKQDGTFDYDGHNTVMQLIQSMTTTSNYTTYKYLMSLRGLCERIRYMVMLRGAAASELVLNKFRAPERLNMIDAHTLWWMEDTAGVYTCKQRTTTTGQFIDLSKTPTFFTAFYRQDPLTIYPDGCFVSAINTLAARQQVINDLYRIMQSTGYPRIDIAVVEESLIKNAPANIRNDSQSLRTWVAARMTDLTNSMASLRADQPFAHTDSVAVSILNDKKPGMAVDISQVIAVLNGQNQAALKTMATVIGRGESGTNTASVEANIFSKNADQINRPVGDILSQVFTYALRLTGSASIVEISFKPAEMRSWSELEPQVTLRQARLLELLSLGLIDDIEFHMIMFSRPPLKGAKMLSGTGFMQPTTSTGRPDAAVQDHTNTDPLGRGIQPAGAKQAKGMVKSKSVQTKPKSVKAALTLLLNQIDDENDGCD